MVIVDAAWEAINHLKPLGVEMTFSQNHFGNRLDISCTIRGWQ
jgi:hypothetical protein